MNKNPDQPRRKTRQAKPVQIGDRRAAADGGEISLVEIMKRRSILRVSRRSSSPRRRASITRATITALLDGGLRLRPARAFPFWWLKLARSPITKISGCPGTVRSGSTIRRADLSRGAPVFAATARPSGEASTPAAHRMVRVGNSSSRTVSELFACFGWCWYHFPVPACAPKDHRFFAHIHDHRARANGNAELFEHALRGSRQLGRIRRKYAFAALDQNDLRLGSVDSAEIAPQGVVGDFSERAGQLDAGQGPPPTITKVIQARSFSGSGSRSAASNASRIRRRMSVASSMVFKPGANLFPLVVAKILMARSRWR